MRIEIERGENKNEIRRKIMELILLWWYKMWKAHTHWKQVFVCSNNEEQNAAIMFVRHQLFFRLFFSFTHLHCKAFSGKVRGTKTKQNRSAIFYLSSFAVFATLWSCSSYSHSFSVLAFSLTVLTHVSEKKNRFFYCSMFFE